MSSDFGKWIAILALVLISVVLFSCSSKDKADAGKIKEDRAVADSIVEDSIVEDTSLKIADCDFMYFRGNKFCFFSMERMDSVVYEGETDEIVNYSFVPGTLGLYYSVCKDSSMVLKFIDFDSEEPMPKHIVNWDLTCADCITETYGTYSGLYMGKDNRYIGVSHDFSWDSYGFRKTKVYDLKTAKFVEREDSYKLLQDDSDYEEEDDDNVNVIRFSEDEYDYDSDDEDLSQTHNYYCEQKGKGKVCLTDKLKFEETPEEYYAGMVSPKGDRVVFGAVTGWGDFPHGPYCIASLDGKYQMILEGTDISYDEGPSMAWLDDGTFLYIANFMADVEGFKPAIMAISPDSTKPVELFKVSEFVMLPKKE